MAPTTEQALRKQLQEFEFNGQMIPDYMVGGMVDYLVHHIAPGGFLFHVFANDLAGAVGRADEKNMKAITTYAAFMYNFLPTTCWGSREKVKKWVEARKSPAEESTE